MGLLDFPGERETILKRLQISQDRFDRLYSSYHFSLLMTRKARGWNDDIDGYARELGILTEREISIAGTDLHQAVLNRIKVRITTERMQATAQVASEPDRERAKTLVHLANCSAISVYAKMSELFPALTPMKNVTDWDFFMTVAIVGSAVFHLQTALDDTQLEPIQRAVAEELAEVYPQAWDALFDLVKFINRTENPATPSGTLTPAMVEKLLNEVRERMGASTGSWIVWNLKGAAPTSDDWPLVSAVGRFCYERLGRELAADLVNVRDVRSTSLPTGQTKPDFGFPYYCRRFGETIGSLFRRKSN